jgi:glycosyltransferase involved in cell wall biosynthesis
MLERCTEGTDRAEYWALAIEVAVMNADLESLRIPPRIRSAMANDPHQRYLLANLSPVSHRLEVINAALTTAGFGSITTNGGQIRDLRSASGVTTVDADLMGASDTLVTVIVPAYNAEHTIEIALDSLRSQTWTNLEILVVDDVSSDATVEVVERVAALDPRVRVIRRTENGGAYRARNAGLKEARGALITVNDGDDWAHCEKIAAQAQHLVDHPEVMANLTSMVRSTEDLFLLRRGTRHSDVCGMNYSSLMVRRSALERVGPWDDVVVEGDSEMLGRLRASGGRESVVHIHQSAPLSVTLRTATSLTQASVTGLGSHRHSTGVRRIYGDAYRRWHLDPGFTEQLPLRRSDDRTPFPAPPLVRRRSDGQHHFDVVIMSDLGLPGGTTSSNLNEIEANESHGLTTGLLHNRNPRFADEGVNPKFHGAHSPLTRLITAGEQVTTDVLVIKYPPTALEIPDIFPQISVNGEILIVANQTPMTSYTGSDQRLVYRIEQVDQEVQRAFGVAPLWVPAGPAVREVLLTHHQAEIAAVRCGEQDWVEIIDQDRWRRAARPVWTGDRPVRIGRHGRDSQWKWPSTAAGILEVYPSDPRYEVRVLGGADVARERLGTLPANWKVLAFDEISPAQWLSELDVFVSFPHPDMVEAFGRTLLEALAVGVPVVTDTRFAELFGDAVIACAPDQALSEVQALMNDPVLYEEMVQRGARLVAERFGFDAHLQRLRSLGLQR